MALPAHWCLTLRPDWDSGSIDGVWIPHEPAETTFIFLLANTWAPRFPLLAVWVPWRPVLSVAFTAVGIPSSIAVSATLVYRIAFYWLRIPVGALAMKWLDMHNLI